MKLRINNRGGINVIVILSLIISIALFSMSTILISNKATTRSKAFEKKFNRIELINNGYRLMNMYMPKHNNKPDFRYVRNNTAKIKYTKIVNNEYYFECILRSQPYKKITFHILVIKDNKYQIYGYTISDVEGEY